MHSIALAQQSRKKDGVLPVPLVRMVEDTS